MPRTARIVVPGVAHHLTQRGNNWQDVFFTDDDRRFYLKTLREQAERFGLAVTGYCVLPYVCSHCSTDASAKGRALKTTTRLTCDAERRGCCVS